MIPIKYQVVGEEDFSVGVDIRSSGEYTISGGTYSSAPPRSGRLTEEQEEQLIAAIKSLGIPSEHPVPDEGEAFAAQLTIGEEGDAVTYHFWEGALEEDTKLKALVRLLEVI